VETPISFSPVFDPASSQAAVISNLFLVVLAVCGVILLIVIGMVSVGLVRFRQKPGAEDPAAFFGSRRLEIAWTVGPILIVIWLFVLTARGMRETDPGPNQKPDLIVISHQWWWEARYPKSGVVTANEIHMPAGAVWLVELDSADVIHDFWVAQLARKMDMVPGHPNHIWLEAGKPGTYMGRCAEYCGAQHATMDFLVMAQSTADFETWQQAQARPALASFSNTAGKGAKNFQELTCANCHAIHGTVSTAQVAPDLTHFGSRQTFAAGLVLNTAANLSRWLENPQIIKPGCLMPNLKLSGAQLTNLVSYLEALK
jgi:cytochrome c oxidase subunit 2